MIVAGTLVHTAQGLVKVEDINSEHDIIGGGWLFTTPKLFRCPCKWLITDYGRIGVDVNTNIKGGDILTFNKIPTTYIREDTYLPYSNNYTVVPSLSWLLGISYGNIPQNVKGSNFVLTYYNINPKRIDQILHFMGNDLDTPKDQSVMRRSLNNEWSRYIWTLFGEDFNIPECICEGTREVQLSFMSGLLFSPIIDFVGLMNNKEMYINNPIMGKIFDQACSLSTHTDIPMTGEFSEEIVVQSVYQEENVVMVDTDCNLIFGPGIKFNEVV